MSEKFYDILLIFAAKYLPYIPTKEELSRELNLGDYEKIGE
jgi:hypothetical protein